MRGPLGINISRFFTIVQTSFILKNFEVILERYFVPNTSWNLKPWNCRYNRHREHALSSWLSFPCWITREITELYSNYNWLYQLCVDNWRLLRKKKKKKTIVGFANVKKRQPHCRVLLILSQWNLRYNWEGHKKILVLILLYTANAVSMETLAARVKFSNQVSCTHRVLTVENTIGLSFPSKPRLALKYIFHFTWIRQVSRISQFC